MSFDTFLASISVGGAPPEGLSPELTALWHTGAKHWDRAHDIAQDIPTTTGSRIHGLLHAIEGDFGNSDYWYRKAGKTPIRKEQIESEWEDLVRSLLAV